MTPDGSFTNTLGSIKLQNWSHLGLIIYFIFVPVFNSSEGIGIAMPIMAFVVVAVVSLVFRFSLSYIFNGKERINIIMVFLIFAFFSYGKIFDIMPGLQFGGIILGRNKVMLTLSFVLFISILILMKSIPQTLVIRLNKIVLIATSILLLLIILPIPKRYINNENNLLVRSTVQNNLQYNTQNPRPHTISNLHNIYYIILDSYMDSGYLKKYYNYDNRWFINTLIEKKFWVSQNSYSNYPFTILSMASTLNMNYIHNNIYPPNVKINVKATSDALTNNKVFSLMSEKGYQIETRTGWVNVLHFSPSLHSFRIQDLMANEYIMIMVRSTMLRIIKRELLTEPLRNQVLSTFKELGTARLSNSPFFVYAHILCPHPPYIFDSNGSAPTLLRSVYGRIENRFGYTDQLAYISKISLDTIDQILKNDKSDPVIVIQGDHGHGYVFGDQLLSNIKPTNPFLHAQMGMLLAIRYPATVKNSNYPGESPVNLYRNICNDLFDSRYELLPDKHYFTKITEPWNFIDVSADLENP